jgi:hypothetical protein
LKKTFVNILRHSPLLIIAAAVVCAYSLTLVTPRYIAPWKILVWGAILGSIRLRERSFRRSSQAIWLSLPLLAAGLALLQAGHGIYGRLSAKHPDDATPDYLTAEGLTKMGVPAGAKLAAIGFDNDAYFAYLDRLEIVAEINTGDTCQFWQSSGEVQAEVMDRLKAAGVQVVVAKTGGGVRSTSHNPPLDIVSCAHPGDGWRQIEGSANHAYFLQ